MPQKFLGYEGPVELLLDSRIDEYWQKDLELYKRVREETSDISNPLGLDDSTYEAWRSSLEANFPELFDPERYEKKFSASRDIPSVVDEPVISLPIESEPEGEDVSEDMIRKIAQEEVSKALDTVGESDLREVVREEIETRAGLDTAG